jgi:minichromosome maintenance protein 10
VCAGVLGLCFLEKKFMGAWQMALNAVQDCLDYEPKPVQKPGRLKGSKASNDAEVDKFSGLRIRSVILFLSKVKKDVKHLNYI